MHGMNDIPDRERIEQSQEFILGVRRHLLALMQQTYFQDGSGLATALSGAEELFWLLEDSRSNLPADSL